MLQLAFVSAPEKASFETLIMQLRSFLSSMNVNIVSVLIKETFFKLVQWILFMVYVPFHFRHNALKRKTFSGCFNLFLLFEQEVYVVISDKVFFFVVFQAIDCKSKMLITLKLENELPVSQTQEVPVSTPSVFVFRGFLFVLLVICKLVEPFCVFFTEFHVPFFLVALSLLLKHSGRRNKNTDLQISVLRAKSWCLTSAGRPADFGAPTCTSKKSFKSFGHRGWHLLAVQRAKDRSFRTTSAGQEEPREPSCRGLDEPGARVLAPASGRWAGKVGWAGQGREPHVYVDPLAK